MGSSSLHFITLTMTLSTLGSLIQTSHLLNNSESARITQSTSGNNVSNSLASEEIFHSVSSSDSMEGSGSDADSLITPRLINQTVISKEPKQASKENLPGSGIPLTPLTLHHSQAHDQRAEKDNTSIRHVDIVSEEVFLEGRHLTAEEQLTENHTFTANNDFLDDGDSPELPLQTNVFTSMTGQNLSEPGLKPCVVLKAFNGTNLLWDDMRRTLAFAWELHVFGSAGLFILMTVLAVLAMAGACTLPHPLCDALMVVNSLLVMGGTLRGVLLLLDPYDPPYPSGSHHRALKDEQSG
ncbi:uncharacterized protein LOC113130151 [Mastacembelus armatus]|uniref:uncharacterized protein LOC113130151 n=1 Tax=Mastacembelus armatus TaxID=205130 RepID=UPI000E45B37B|nr:uncharacterized protein LOC113130151 [Mastacembelus armatus]